MDINSAIELAIQSEIEGREFYRMLAQQTSDRKARKVFMDLSADEDMHLVFLKRLSKTLQTKDLNLNELKLPSIRSFDDTESPIFSRQFKEFVKNADLEISALSIGIKLELEAVEFYKKMANSTEDKRLKELFEYLAEWEKSHYEALNSQLNFFKKYLATKTSFFRGF